MTGDKVWPIGSPMTPKRVVLPSILMSALLSLEAASFLGTIPSLRMILASALRRALTCFSSCSSEMGRTKIP